MRGPEQAIEFLHGYTYSGHPIACAAGLATLDAMESDGLVGRAAQLARVLEEAVHSLQDEPHVSDVRNFGLAAAVELRPREGQPGARGREAFERGVDAGLLLRFTADTIAVAPPFISSEEEIVNMIASLRGVLRRIT
jgi:beta-alanine--pyruvate transaminase